MYNQLICWCHGVSARFLYKSVLKTWLVTRNFTFPLVFLSLDRSSSLGTVTKTSFLLKDGVTYRRTVPQRGRRNIGVSGRKKLHITHYLTANTEPMQPREPSRAFLVQFFLSTVFLFVKKSCFNSVCPHLRILCPQRHHLRRRL